MLVEFSVENYRSFKERVTFSMVAANLVAKDKELDENNVFDVDSELKLLKSAAIYGANASGKSNLIKALSFMKWFAINSSKNTQSTDAIDVESFALSTKTEGKPSHFEIVFVMDGKKYRYGFEVTRKRVISEWLYRTQKRETRLFERESDNFTISKSYKANGIQQKTRHNALFLSVSAQFNVEIAERILDWLESKLKVVSGLNDTDYRGYTIRCLLENRNRNQILRFLRGIDLGFSDLKVEEREVDFDSLPFQMPDEFKDFILRNSSEVRMTSVRTLHRRFDEKGHFTSTELFDLDAQESEGTQKVFALAGLLADTLEKGKTLLVDEFDARLHPLISCAIVKLFNSAESNPNNAQLIFATHDTNLLSNKMFRRDQIWFTEKDRYAATDLYSLAEYKVRNDASFESDYIKGKYGAIPYIGDLTDIVDTHG